MRHHLTATIRRVPIIRLPDQHQGRCRHRSRGDAAAGVICDHRAEALIEILCGQLAIDGAKSITRTLGETDIDVRDRRLEPGE
jgi:hypothetical protein